jgi:hypothetical protein
MFMEKHGRIPDEKIKEGILKDLPIDSSELEELVCAFEANTKLAIFQIHRTFFGNPKITEEEAKETMRNSLFYLSDDCFDEFWKWSHWCVSKGA